uniref:RanBD1 domain-containing protein n=1 Tax=Ananas comosus var. bracteatus TaxID=296719 RepID=A0A6V7QFJ3_ANACO|nr:unnamed protein product [Ananas comosus var. bracteatus]
MASTADVERRDEEETNEPGAGDDEDTGAQVAPIVKLEEVAVTTGEEEEDVLLDMKAKLYRFDKDGNQWKERGTGNICANHLVVSTTKMQEHAGNDKSCVWHATDFADGELKEEMFAIRFGSVENCKKFMEVVEEIAESLRKSEEKESEEASSAAGLLEKLTVTESKTEESEIKEASASTEKKGEAKLETEAKAGEASSWRKVSVRATPIGSPFFL